MYCSLPIYPSIWFAATIAGLVIYALVWWWNERQINIQPKREELKTQDQLTLLEVKAQLDRAPNPGAEEWPSLNHGTEVGGRTEFEVAERTGTGIGGRTQL